MLVRDVLARLAERGFADIEAVIAAEESILFSLPSELRRDLKAAGTKAETIRHDGAFEDAGSLH